VEDTDDFNPLARDSIVDDVAFDPVSANARGKVVSVCADLGVVMNRLKTISDRRKIGVRSFLAPKGSG
jgi:hypothetical protein